MREVSARVPALLVGERQLAACRTVAASLPPGAEAFYLECRLDSAPRVDFLAMVRRRRGAAQGFVAARQGLAESYAWRKNHALLSAWSEGAGDVADAPLLWFEYDIDERFDAGVLDASPSICVERGYYSRYAREPDVDVADAGRVARGALAQLLAPAWREADSDVCRCIQALPKGGSLIHVSTMLARAERVVKLYLSLPKSDVLEYLERIAWPGNLAAIEGVLGSWYAPVANTVFLDISIQAGTLPRLGLALSQLHQREMRRFDPSWGWVPLPRAADAKKRELAAWPGVSEARVDGVRTWIHRWVDLKVVVPEAGPPEFKAYLGFGPALPPPFA